MSIFQTLSKAAAGDKDAQIAMVRYATDLIGHPDTDAVFALTEASVFARLAAAQGGDDERSLLACTLSDLGVALQAKGQGELSDAMYGEAVAHVDAMAESGNVDADNSLPVISGNASKAIMQNAKIFKDYWREENV
ncbi:hypothetical protein [Parasphingorhabdus sp.]|uniref:hypothetical protein n=1 Tax=Parasphingorhabdus sp. TaxID=2709688 RepID=UPI003A953E8B